MDDFIPTKPPTDLLEYLVPVFFLITALFRKNVAFLVFFDGKIEWLMLDQRMIDAVRDFQLQIRIDQIDWHRLCQHFFSQFQQLPFYLHQRIQGIDWNDVIFFRRTMQVRLQNGRIVYARYIEDFGEMPCDQSGKNEHHIKCQIRGTDEEVVIPISAILNHIPPRKDVDEYDEKLAQEKAKEKATRDAEEAQQQSEAYKAQMMERGEIIAFPKIQRDYPLFNPEFMLILFFICKKNGIEIGFGYRFNLIVRRLVCFVRRSKSQRDQPGSPPQNLPKEYNKALEFFMKKSTSQFPEEDIKAFEAFVDKYMTQFVGRVIRSRTIRFQLFIAPIESRIPEYLHRVFEYHCHLTKNYSPTQADVDAFLKKGDEYFSRLAEEMTTRSENPLTLSDEYWTNWREFGVLTMVTKSRYTMCEVIFPMIPTPTPFPCDLF
jgi:hypothetical protein